MKKNIKQIKKNCKIVDNIKNIINKEKSIEEQLNLIQVLCNYLWENITGIYRDKDIENIILDISDKIFKGNKAKDSYLKNIREETLHIITETYTMGGHTRLLYNWLKFDIERKNDILIVKPENSKIPNWLDEILKLRNGNLILINKNTIIEKATKIREICKNYNEIVLHIHPDDIATVLALSSFKNKRIFFMNHSDHSYSLGYNLASCVLELTKDGKKMGEKKRDIKNSAVLPIPISIEKKMKNEDTWDIRKKFDIPLENKIIVSMAASYKYKKMEGYDFYDFLEKLIAKNNKITILMIGPSLLELEWKKLKLKLGNNLLLLGILKKEDVQNILEQSDIYVDSFPVNSYMCLLEAIRIGKEAYSLKTPVFDLDSLKETKINTIDEMINKILNSKIKNNKGIEKLIKYHSEEEWLKRIKKIREKYINKSNFIKRNKNSNCKIEFSDYEEFLYDLKKGSALPFSWTYFKNISIINKIKILLIIKFEFINYLKILIKKNYKK